MVPCVPRPVEASLVGLSIFDRVSAEALWSSVEPCWSAIYINVEAQRRSANVSQSSTMYSSTCIRHSRSIDLRPIIDRYQSRLGLVPIADSSL